MTLRFTNQTEYITDASLTDDFIKKIRIHDTERDLPSKRIDLVFWVQDMKEPFVQIFVVPAPIMLLSTMLRMLRFHVREKLRENYGMAEFMCYREGAKTEGDKFFVVLDYPKEIERFTCL